MITIGALSTLPEEWRPVPGGWPYAVSSWGRVWSFYVGRLMSPVESNHGHVKVHLYLSGRKWSPTIQRLVWGAFRGEVPPAHRLHHVNMDKDDNRLENLEARPYRQVGFVGSGEANPRARLTEDAVREIRANYQSYSGRRGTGFFARKFGVRRSAISKALYGRTWKHVS